MNKLYLRMLLPMVILVAGGASVLAQTTITGTVKEGGSEETLAGVNVVVKGRVTGTITNINGQFTLKINQPPPLTLSFSFIGFKTQEITVGNQTALNITLKSDVTALEEVVVTGYTVDKRRELTGSVSSVKPKDL